MEVNRVTQIGIKQNVLATLICIIALVGGYTSALLILGYIAFFESNALLRRIAVKAVVLMCCFSLLGIIIDILPNIVFWIYDLVQIFSVEWDLSVLINICNFLNSTISLLEIGVFLYMAFLALIGRDIRIKWLDQLLFKKDPSSDD